MYGYSFIGAYGDSIMRHQVLAMYMLLRDDWIFGANGPQFWSKYPKLWNKPCICDGQFSENLDCREPWEIELSIANVHRLGLCSTIFPKTFDIAWLFGKQNKKIIPCDSRPAIIFIHFGLVLNYDIDIAKFQYQLETEIIEPLLSSDVEANCYNLKFIVTGPMRHSPLLDIKYPLQANVIGDRFNEELAYYIDSLPKIYNFTFLNMSSIGLHGATSDGFHPLSDSHALSMMYIANVMDMLVKPS